MLLKYLLLLYLSIYFFKEIKMLLFHIFNTETIDRSIVFKTAAELFTGNLNNFRGICNWTSLIGQTTVIVMRDPLALSSLSSNPDFFVNISKIS